MSPEGSVNLADLVIAKRIILGYITPTTIQTHALDVGPVVDGISQPDDMLSVADVLLLTRKNSIRSASDLIAKQKVSGQIFQQLL